MRKENGCDKTKMFSLSYRMEITRVFQHINNNNSTTNVNDIVMLSFIYISLNREAVFFNLLYVSKFPQEAHEP